MMFREGRILLAHLIGLSSPFRCILSWFRMNLCVLICFVSAPIDDGAVQRLRDLIVSFALSSLLLMRYSASTPLV